MELVISNTDNNNSSKTSPSHYNQFNIQPMKFIRDNNIDFLRGNVIKYLMRHENKNGLEDLQKAFVYFCQHAKYMYGEDGVNAILNTKWDTIDNPR